MNRYWLPTGVAFICHAMGIGMLGAFGFFVKPLSEEFNMGVAAINAGPVFLLIAPAFVAPFVGKFIDSGAIRNVMLLGVLIAFVTLAVLSQMQAIVWLGVCFAGFAVGQVFYGPVVLNSLLVKIYNDRVGRALAISAMGVSLGSVVWPFVTAYTMDSFGWRITLMVLAACLLVVMGLCVRLGLPAHVTVAAPLGTQEDAVGDDKGYLKTPAFWLIGIAASMIYNVAFAVSICYAPHFGQLGFSHTDVAAFIAAGGFGGMTGKLVVASFADRFRAHIRGFSMFPVALMLTGLTILVSAESYSAAMASTAFLGAAGGAFIPLHPFINSAYYKADIIGEVNGAQAPIMLPMGIVCAPMAGYIFDSTGSYQQAFMAAMGLMVASMACILLLPRVASPASCQPAN